MRAEIRESLGVRRALVLRLWNHGADVDEVAERLGLSANIVRDDLAISGVTGRVRTERKLTNAGRLANAAYPLCRACGTPFSDPQPRKEFCGPVCARKFDRDRQRQYRPQPATPERLREVRERWRRRFWAELRELNRHWFHAS